eukprot:145873_1
MLVLALKYSSFFSMALQPNAQANDENDKVPTVKHLKLMAYDLYHNKIQKSPLTPEGFGKLKRKVFKELQHLETLDENSRYNSSNIHYLNAIWQTIDAEGNTVCGVFKKYKYMSLHRKCALIVDVVCDDGLRWIKVKTSNPYSMQLQFLNSGTSSGAKNIITMADNFLCASAQHQVYFSSPKIEFVFVEGITSDLAYILKQKCISIKGEEIKDDFVYEDESSSASEHEEEIKDKLDETCVNVGVRSMLTMISSLSNGEINRDFFDELQLSLNEKDRINGKTPKKMHKIKTKTNLDFEYCDYPKRCVVSMENARPTNDLNENGFTKGHESSFKRGSRSYRKKFSEKSYEEQKMLHQMYCDEMHNPVLPSINKCIQNKKLLCCETAWNHFMDICHLSAGENEWKRCNELQNRIIIVSDQISPRTEQLSGKSMSHINKCVFGTGDSMRIITLTAIASFVRKAEQRGVKYFVHIHPVRPLTERYQKEYAKKIKNQMKQNDDELIKQRTLKQCGSDEESIEQTATAAVVDAQAVAGNNKSNNEEMLLVD